MQTMEQVRQRVSFKGIYMLHDNIQSAIVSIDQNQQAFQSYEQKTKALEEREEEREIKIKELEAEIDELKSQNEKELEDLQEQFLAKISAM